MAEEFVMEKGVYGHCHYVSGEAGSPCVWRKLILEVEGHMFSYTHLFPEQDEMRSAAHGRAVCGLRVGHP